MGVIRIQYFRITSLVTVAVMLTSCSLVDPFVTRGVQPVQPGVSSIGSASPSATGAVSLIEARDYAEKVKEAYRGALRDQAYLQSWLGIGLIPLTAAAIGLGATGTSPNTVLSLGLGGASALGVGTWLNNKPRQLAWAAGIKAVTCAEDAMTPLNLSATATTDLNSNLGKLQVALTTLDQKAADLETQVDKAKAVRQTANTREPEISRAARALESIETSARAELKELTAVRTAAEAALTSGAELKHTLSIAGEKLVVAVKKITDEVDSIVVDTQRDPQALATIIAGLGSMYGTLTTVPKGMAPQVAKEEASKKQPTTPQSGELRTTTEAEKANIEKEITRIRSQEDQLTTALQAVRQAQATVASERRAVSDIVNSVVKDAPLDKLKGCGVNAADLKTALTVDPAGPFEITKPGSVAFTIKGGLPPYGATLGGGLANLIVAQSVPFSPAVNVIATNDTTEGQFTVVVSDSSNQTKTVMVTVKKGDGKPDGGQPTPATAEALKQFAEKLDSEKPTVKVNEVTVGVTKAAVRTNFVEVTINEPTVGPSADTQDVSKKLQKELIDNHGGKELNLQENQIKFDSDSLKMLNKDALDKKKQITGSQK